MFNRSLYACIMPEHETLEEFIDYNDDSEAKFPISVWPGRTVVVLNR